MGFPRNLGGPVASVVRKGRAPGRKPRAQAPLRCVRHGGERKARARDGNRQAKGTKRGGTGNRKSELLTVPVKRGNQPEGPRGGRGKPGYGTTGGKDAGNTESRKRLNETTADSRTGEEGIGAGVHDAGPSHRSRAVAGSLPEDPEGRRDWDRRPDGDRVRGEPAGEPAV